MWTPLAARKLTSAPPGSRGDSNPAFSPDGKTMAFTRGSQTFQSIYTVPVSGGEEQRLVSQETNHWGLAWTPDGQRIVFANVSWPINAGWLWSVPVRGGKAERLLFGQEGIEPSIRGNRLAYVRQTGKLSIWKRELRSPVAASPPTKFNPPHDWIVVLNSRPTVPELRSNPPAAAPMKFGCAAATPPASYSLPTLIRRQGLRAGRRTDGKLLSTRVFLATETFMSSMPMEARRGASPVIQQAKSCPVRRGMGSGCISHP